MELNLWTVFAAAVLAMVIGVLWYGPLFGKAWTRVIGATDLDLKKRKEMQKKAMPLYGIQFVLALVQVFILAQLVVHTSVATAVSTALVMYVAFVVPTLAGSAMWNNDSTRVKWTRFGLQAGYQAVVFVAFGIVLALWS